MKRFTPKVVTANDLLTGEVVYLTAEDRWSPEHGEAELILDEAHADLRLLFAEAQPGVVLDAYLADAQPGPHGPEPLHIREVLRTRGPSNLPHGKQERAREVTDV